MTGLESLDRSLFVRIYPAEILCVTPCYPRSHWDDCVRDGVRDMLPFEYQKNSEMQLVPAMPLLVDLSLLVVEVMLVVKSHLALNMLQVLYPFIPCNNSIRLILLLLLSSRGVKSKVWWS